MSRRSVVLLVLAMLLVVGGIGVAVTSSGGDAAPAEVAKTGKKKKKKKKGRKKGRKGQQGDGGPPNVLVVVWDTVRADRMSLYGHDRPTTPQLDAFARDARVWDHAISPATWTVPAHASLFTGLPVSTHGANASWRWVDHHHVTMAEHLSANGYATFAYSANPYVSGMTNLLQGFENKRYSWDHDKRPSASLAKAKLIETDRSTEVSPAWPGDKPDVAWDQSVHKEASRLATGQLKRWLLNRKDKQKPWFAFLNLMEAHSPRLPAMTSRKALIGDPDLVELGLQTDASLWTEVSAILGEHTYTADEIEAMRAVYDATLLELDTSFGELMAGLHGAGVLDDTIIVLTSDHGESLGEHGLWEHRYGVWNTLVHVPLVIRYPDELSPGRVAEPVSTAAIFPTVLDLIGLDPPEGVELPHSLRRKGGGGAPVFTQLTDPYTSKLGPFKKAYPKADFSPFIRRYDAMFDGRHKVVRPDEGDPALYDLVADPGELQDVFARNAAANGLLSRLDAWRAAVRKADPALRVPADLKKGRGSKTEEAAMEHMLEQLGYTEADTDGEAL